MYFQETAQLTDEFTEHYQELLLKLFRDNITYNIFNNPVIASDGYIYDINTYNRITKDKSPFTGQPFNQEQFPIILEDLYNLIQSTEPFEDNLLRFPTLKSMQAFTTDPISKQIMTEPVIAILDVKSQFIPIICDNSTLAWISCIGRIFYGCTIKSKRDFIELQDVINHVKSELPPCGLINYITMLKNFNDFFTKHSPKTKPTAPNTSYTENRSQLYIPSNRQQRVNLEQERDISFNANISSVKDRTCCITQ